MVVAAEPGFVKFVESRSAALLRTAMLLCHGDRHAAEDVVRTALIKAYLSWRRIRRPESAEPYVRAVLVRTAIDQQRSHHVRVEHLAPVSRESAPAGVGDLDERLQLWPYLESLSARQRAVVVLRYYEDLSEEQIAHVLGCSLGAVKTDTRHALTTLRQTVDVDGTSTAAQRGIPMPDEVEVLLARKMRADVDETRVDTDFLHSTLHDAVAVRRRRRVMVTAVSGAAVLAAIVASTIAAFTSSPEATPPIPPRSSTTTAATGSVQPAKPYAWAGTLPSDVPPRVPFITGGVLRAPGLEYRLGGGNGGIAGAVHGGWLVRLYPPPRYVVVPAAGHPTPLPAANSQVDGAAVSPDGQRVAYGGQVIDVATRRVVATMPGGAKIVVGWIRPGVVYTDVNGGARLWKPGGTPHRLGVRLAGPLGDGNTLLDTTGSCGRAVEVSPEAILTTLYRGCDAADPMGLSPRGTTVLTVAGQAVDLLTGDRTPLPLPLVEAASRGQLGWEDEHTIVFPVYRGRSGSAVRFVRCTTPDGSCSLAGPAHAVK